MKRKHWKTYAAGASGVTITQEAGTTSQTLTTSSGTIAFVGESVTVFVNDTSAGLNPQSLTIKGGDVVAASGGYCVFRVKTEHNFATDGSDVFFGLNWACVGDSLLYHLHRWQLSKCNATHNLQERFKRLLETGSISTAEYEAIEEPLALTSALGPHKLHEIDCQKGQLEPGDRLLVASDGLLTLPRAAIQTQLSEPASAQSVADHLLQATLNLKHATQDNISLIVISPSAAVTAGTQVDTLPTSWWTRWLSLLLAIFLMSIVAGLYGLFIVNEPARVPTEPQSSLKPAANRLIGITQATQPLQTNLPPQPSTPVKESKDGTRQIPELLIWPKPSSSALNH